ncbi:putative ABC transport system permease protein [Methanolobus vulcani]|jgi:putative ABC transport system permease protein|uniref:Putative ABC transport system permease protein n=1 Tax=Methanolobus vulcani TaxID=38026 RepID=A0A7Z7AXN6_9EURY|nr:FtsX-like permease family protein [Methanolobus vulcani]MDK2826342.1 putative transport system permease protein [Methanolobus sp.]MDK2948765.1 putative transport system permease protein [Methanolobus sp.]SDG05428.1 putative ABC transport system permease protein [Methanolobus vulcani]
MIDDIRVGVLIASSSIKRGNKKTLLFIVFVLSLIFMNLVFLPSMIGGMTVLFTGIMQDYPYGDIVIEPTGDNTYINNADNVLQKVRAVEGVRAATKRLDVGASIEHKQNVVGVTITGVIPTEEYEISQYPYIIKEGDFLGELSRDEIIIGSIISGTSTTFGEIYDDLGETRVGSLVDVTYSNGVKRTYKVKGIMEGNFELVDLNAMVHYKEIEDVYGLDKGKATSVVVRIDEPGTEDEMKAKIREAGVNEQVFTWADKSETLIRQALQSLGAIDVMSKFVGLIVGAALILIIIYINILNRKKEIGILKAVGITPRSIVLSYAFLSMFYVSLGIFAGLILYLSLMFYFQANPVVFYETMEIRPQIDVMLVIQSIVTMLTLSVIAGTLPAWSVSKESILKAIWGR